MNLRKYTFRTLFPVALIAVFTVCLASISAPASGTVVRFNSVMGSFDVRMFNARTSLTVANILNYVNTDRFDNSIVHRVDATWVQQANGSFVLDPFVIQSGDSVYPAGGVLTQITQDAVVQNEPGISNLRGTMALAKGNQPSSGTNNWYINLDNNSFLDTSTGGFTVFGRVVGNGMDVVDAISRLPTHQIQQAGTTVPMRGDLSQGITRDNFVIFTSVEVLNIPDGDYDFDGDVDGADFLLWQRSFGSTTNVAADGNGNAVVDAADLALWSNNYGAGPPLSTTVSVPEPATLVLLLLGLFAKPQAVWRVFCR